VSVLVFCCLQIKKVQADKERLFQENEDQASEYSGCPGDCCPVVGPLAPTLLLMHILYLMHPAINLGHEPELQEGWEQLQQKVTITHKHAQTRAHTHYIHTQAHTHPTHTCTHTSIHTHIQPRTHTNLQAHTPIQSAALVYVHNIIVYHSTHLHTTDIFLHQFLELEALKEEHDKMLNQQRQLIEVSKCVASDA